MYAGVRQLLRRPKLEVRLAALRRAYAGDTWLDIRPGYKATILVHGSAMEPWYYDAPSSIISTQDTIAMEGEFGLFAAVVVALRCCSEQQLDTWPASWRVFTLDTRGGGGTGGY